MTKMFKIILISVTLLVALSYPAYPQTYKYQVKPEAKHVVDHYIRGKRKHIRNKRKDKARRVRSFTRRTTVYQVGNVTWEIIKETRHDSK